MSCVGLNGGHALILYACMCVCVCVCLCVCVCFAESLLFLVHHSVRLWCSPTRWLRAVAIPVQISWNFTRFPSLV